MIFDEREYCEWCDAESRGVTLRNDGIWSPSCGEPTCSDDGPYRGAR